MRTDTSDVWWWRVALLLFGATLVVGSALAATPRPPLTRLPRAARAPATARTLACPAGPTRCKTYAAFLTWAGSDVRQFWAEEFTTAGIHWRPAGQVSVPRGSTSHTRCNGGILVTAQKGPFYCAIDGAAGKIFLPLVGIQALIFPGYPSYVPHAFAVSYVVAHEWAHHVQQLLGLLHGRHSIRIELQADCLAGVWGHTAWARNLVSNADIDRTLRLANLIGDVPGTPAGAGTHGTGQQRVSAFLAGYNSGSPAACADR